MYETDRALYLGFTMKTKTGEDKQVRFWELPREDQKNKIKKRIKDICRTTYKKTHETETVLKKDTVCMRENPFYVDTVRAFRDRRYTYKNLQKVWGKKQDQAKKVRFYVDLNIIWIFI
jgi:DNA polymerase elongation subunit (family B)